MMNSQQGYATAIMRLLRSAQICVLSLLALLVIVVTSDTHVIKMAVILPYNNKYLFSMERTMPAIEYAIEAARRYRPNLEFEVHRGDSKCSSVWGALNAFEFYRSNSVHVFLGPVCDYSLGPVARYAPYWQIPVLSAGGMSHDYRIQKQSEYFSLTRTGATFDSLARIVRSLFETQFGWRSLVILSRRPQTTDEQQVVEPINRLCHLATSAINFEYRTNNLKYDYYQVDETKGIEDIELALREKVGKRYSGGIDMGLCLISVTARKKRFEMGDKSLGLTRLVAMENAGGQKTYKTLARFLLIRRKSTATTLPANNL